MHESFSEPFQPLWVINSTIARNADTGIFVYQNPFTLTNVTIAENGDNGVFADTTSGVINNSILARNAPDCATFAATVDINYSLITSSDDA